MLIQSFSPSLHKNDDSDKHVINFTDNNYFLNILGIGVWSGIIFDSLECGFFYFSQYLNVNIENLTLCETHSVYYSNVRNDGTNKCTQVYLN